MYMFTFIYFRIGVIKKQMDTWSSTTVDHTYYCTLS